MSHLISAFSWVKGMKLWGILLGIIVVILGLLRIQSSRLENSKEEIEKVKTKAKINIKKSEVETYQKNNKAKKDAVDESIKNNDTSLKPNTIYKL